MSPFEQLGYLVVISNRLVAGLVTPLFDHYNWDKFVLQYISWAVAAGLVALTGANLFEGQFVISRNWSGAYCGCCWWWCKSVT